jgi:Arc-like DNA binding domain
MTPFKLRLPDPLRAEIEESARRSGRSINTEIVERLEQSVRQDQQSREIFGDDDAARITRMVARAMSLAGQRAAELLEGNPDWAKHPWAYQQASAAAASVLGAMKPLGEVVAPEIKTSPGSVDERTIALFMEATMQRLGANIGAYLATKGDSK